MKATTSIQKCHFIIEDVRRKSPAPLDPDQGMLLQDRRIFLKTSFYRQHDIKSYLALHQLSSAVCVCVRESLLNNKGTQYFLVFIMKEL